MLRDETRHVGSRETKRDMVSSARILPSDSEVTRSKSSKTRTLYRYVILHKGLRGLNFQRRLHAASQRLDPNSADHIFLTISCGGSGRLHDTCVSLLIMCLAGAVANLPDSPDSDRCCNPKVPSSNPTGGKDFP